MMEKIIQTLFSFYFYLFRGCFTSEISSRPRDNHKSKVFVQRQKEWNQQNGDQNVQKIWLS